MLIGILCFFLFMLRWICLLFLNADRRYWLSILHLTFFLFTLFTNDLNLCRFFEFLIFLEFAYFWLKYDVSRIVGKQTTKIDLFEEFSLILKGSTDIVFVLFVVFNELIFSKIKLLILTAQWIVFICWYWNIVNYWVVMEFNIFVVFLKFFHKTINKHCQVFRFLGYWFFQIVYFSQRRFFLSKFV